MQLQAEKFVDKYVKCPCCRTKFHTYHYPRVNKGAERDFSKCLLCIGEEKLKALRARFGLNGGDE